MSEIRLGYDSVPFPLLAMDAAPDLFPDNSKLKDKTMPFPSHSRRHAYDADPVAELKAWLQNRLSSSDHTEACNMINSLGAGAEDDLPDLRPDGTPQPYLGAQDHHRYALDSHNAGRIVSDREVAIEECGAICPREILIGQDSAAGVFRQALARMGVDHAGVHASALPALFRQAKRAQSGQGMRPRMTSVGNTAFDRRFPDASRIRTV